MPWASLGIAATQLYVFLLEQRALRWGLLNTMVDDYAFRWSGFIQQPLVELPRLLSCTFLHANGSHLLGNLVFFLLFASAVEKAMGPLWFVAGYFVWGAVAALTQGFFSPFDSGLIGASGAISGVAGAFFVLFPLAKPVHKIPAFFLIGLWFVSQLNDGFRLLLPDPLEDHAARVAYWAHIGGFAAGALSVFPLIFPVAKRNRP